MPTSDHGPLGALDTSARQRDARARALVERATGRMLDVGQADPADLGDGEGPFDTIVSTFALCRVPDLDATLAGVRRLLAADGRLLFLEHVPPPGWRRRARRATVTGWSRLAGGCHFDRDIPNEVRRAGLLVTDLERFTMPTAVWPLRTCVEGAARPSRRVAGGAA